MVREIQIRTPDGATRSVRLERDKLTLGRSSANELCFPDDAGLSRQHLTVEREGDDWMVRDLGSKNGTLVNGIRITGSTRLQPGDRITAGHLVLQYADPFSGANDTVIFVEGTGMDTPTSSTVITSLEGLLASQQEKAVSGTTEVAGHAPLEGAMQVQALIRVGRELVGHRPLAELFPVVMDLAVEAVGASRGVLMTLEGENLIVRAAKGDGFRISTFVRDKVLVEKQSLLVRDAQLEDVFKERMSIVEQRVRSMMAVPLQTNENVIGLIYVDSPHMVREFGKEDLNLLTVMANVAAIRIEHARLNEVEQVERVMAKDLEQAAEIQRRLLPTAAPTVSGLDAAGYNAPCRTVGGDYYDFFAYPDGRLAILVADVAGKGMPAAMLMSSLQARVQVLAEESIDLASLVTRLNFVISKNCPANRFITFFMCVLDPVSGDMTYCNAGHNPPLLVRKDGSVENLEGGGIILGIMPRATYQDRRINIDTGDVVVLFSDGVTEAVRPDADVEFGEERLAAIVHEHRNEPVRDIIDAVNDAINEWTGGAPAADDVTLVIARRTSS